MSDLDALVLFARVVEAGSFSEAARSMRSPVSTVSRKIADLELRLGVRLLERTTRSLRVTSIGAEVFQQARRGAEIGEAVAAIISSTRTDGTQLLRISTPPSISDTLVAPLVSAFQAQHPGAMFDILVTERPVDLKAEGIDLSFTGARLRDTTLVARKLLTYRHQLVASPAYLAVHEPVEAPMQLLEHRLLAFSRRRPHNHWRFRHATSSEERTITFEPFVAMNDFAGLVKPVLDGLGIGILPPLVQPHLLRDGRLVEVMPHWRFRTFDLSLVHVGGRQVSRLLRSFKDVAVKNALQLFPHLPT